MNKRIIGIVMVFWLIGWFVRTPYFLTYLFGNVLRYPVTLDFFPAFFQSGEVAVILFFLPLLVVPSLLRPGQGSLLVAAVVLTVAAALSALHIDTYNDATNVTCFWVGLWLLWASANMHREDEGFRWQACLSAQLIVAMIFLGGAVGKKTAEYWNGQVWRHMFLEHDRFLVSTVVHQITDTTDMTGISTVLSRFMIGAEWTIALIPVLPYRLGAGVAIVMMVLMMPMTNTILIFSVLGCLIGMLIAGWMWCPVTIDAKTRRAVL